MAEKASRRNLDIAVCQMCHNCRAAESVVYLRDLARICRITFSGFQR
ncbi:Hydrogenase iron-sulfur subunit [Caenorhabditis elegans]|uniref:Hydrogenase iron-sulfur subunit n=1 Tax=Caenorhabditis elegans TaxID=6239 RepID=Q9BKS6_CAEEL|nr:Hydrogenase iron-sulfur subunit [Caenorhabditis elegans]CCD73037.1 Hydrogenase iron-sulfur subunit [Caenorhabditis elegans]|eukprot:NP_497400.1 Uncharacterized protein CELE_Y82E9BR.6 [Caenorhabditis elegans]